MPKRILLIDDERSIREALSKVLREEQYEVLLAETGPEAVEKYGRGPIDLLLLDLNLPGGNGWTALQWLARLNPFLPVIIITGRSEQRELAQRAGADALMEKPLDVPRLLETIRELIDKPGEGRAERASHRTLGFRYLPCDEAAFRSLLHQRFTLPFPAQALTETPGQDAVERPQPVGAPKPL